jgi:two-component system sensor histidine kinase MprB
MNYRTRLTLLTCAAIAVTLVAASIATWSLARHDAYAQIDDAMTSRIESIRALQAALPEPPDDEVRNTSCVRIPGLPPGAAGDFARVLDEDGDEAPTSGRQCRPGISGSDGRQASDELQADAEAEGRRQQFHLDEDSLPAKVRESLRSERIQVPVTDASRRVARSADTDEILVETVEVDDTRFRVVTGHVGNGFTVQTARTIDETDEFLTRLVWLLALVTLGGVGVGVAVAFAVTGAASAPVHRLTETTEAVRESGDLSQRVEVTGSDDLARLAQSFNEMLQELERSVARQQRLVDDASHQLRTPLAAIRTNMDVLLRARSLDEAIVSEVLADLSSQVDELTGLVRDLVDLAATVESSLEREPVRLDEVAEEAVRRVRSVFPRLTFELELEATFVEGSQERLVRMIQNLLHNAGKWSRNDSIVRVEVEPGVVRVIDYGSGVPDEEKPRIFERFHRAADVRDVPGSGLGLSIVQQIATDHAGSVSVHDTPGGGATFVVYLPEAEHIAI